MRTYQFICWRYIYGIWALLGPNYGVFAIIRVGQGKTKAMLLIPTNFVIIPVLVRYGPILG
jgi:hypothetical protein